MTSPPTDARRWHAAIRTGLLIASAAATGVLVLALVHCFFAVPLTDDFHFRTSAREQGYLPSMAAYWNGASGRLTSLTLVLSVYHWVDFLTLGHALALVFFLLLNLAACIIYAAVIFRTRVIALRTALPGLLLFAVYWGQMPLPGESFYWMPEAVQIQPAFFLFALLLLVLQPSRDLSVRTRWIAAPLLALVFSLLHEWLTLLGGFALFLLAIASFRRGSPTTRIYLAVLPVMAAGLAVTTMAPGTHARIDKLEAGSHLSLSMFKAVYERFQGDIGEWVGNPSFPVFFVLMLLLASWFHPEEDLRRIRHPRHALLILLSLLVGIFLGLLAFRIGTGEALPWMPRVLNVLFLALLSGAMAVAAKLPLPPTVARPSVILITAAILAMTMLNSPNVRTAVRDLRNGKTRQYRDDYEALHERLKEKAGSGEKIVLEEYPEAPGVFAANILSSHPSFWVNRRMAEYYGVEALVYTDGPRLGIGGARL